MPERSTILSLPFIQPSQAQKHVTHNEAIDALDIYVQLSVQSRVISDPPSGATNGDRYIVATGGTAECAGQDGNIAVLVEGLWVFHSPGPGWRAYVEADQELVVFDGAWGQLPAPAELQNMSLIGVNTTADATNRIAVSAPATLLTHEGGGHQLKVNKAGVTDTASLLFQDNWSGRAEMGLSGSDNFEIKVSADGSLWSSAIRLDALSGAVSFPSGGARELLSAQRIWYVDPTSGSDTNDGLTNGAGAFASIAAAIDAAMAVDAGGQTLTVQLADGNHTLGAALQIPDRLVGAARLEIIGNTTTPSNVTVSTPDTAAITVSGGIVSLQGMRLETSGAGDLLQVGRAATVELSGLIFGAATGNQITNNGGEVAYTGACDIEGGAQRHLSNTSGGLFDTNGQTITLTATPVFGIAFLSCEDGATARLLGGGFNGTAAGSRYLATRNAIINTGGQGSTFLPGDSAGTTSNGGLFL